GPAVLPLARALVVARTERCPRRQVPVCGEAREVCADIGHQDLGRAPADARHRVDVLNLAPFTYTLSGSVQLYAFGNPHANMQIRRVSELGLGAHSGAPV